MDPASALALVTSSLAVATKTLKNVKDLSSKYQNAEQSVQMLVAKLGTIRAALAQLQVLLRSERTHRLTTPQLQSALVSAMGPCTLVMKFIDHHVCQVRAGWLQGRLRYLWEEDTIKEHSLHLDGQISALNLLLQVVQLSSANEQRDVLERRQSRRILTRAQDYASSYLSSSTSDSSNTRDGVEFEFDNQVIDSTAYRSAFLKWSDSRQAAAKSSASLSSLDKDSMSASVRSKLADKDLEEFPEKHKPISLSTRLCRWYGFRQEPGIQTSTLTRRRQLISFTILALIVIGVVSTIVSTQVLRGRNELSRGPQNSTETSPPSFLAGFPIIPLGTAVVINTMKSKAISGCVDEGDTLWSCNAPPDDHADTSLSSSTPTFEFKITTNETDYNAPSPDQPSLQDQVFLGNTTDNITTLPFSGLPTPFLISFLSSTAQPRLRARQILDLSDLIPSPALNYDGTAAAPVLNPLPLSQPLHLFDAGLPTEHYGFYTYFDRRIYANTSALSLPSSFGNYSEIACTWAQTRFLVQIWTRALSSTSGSDFALPVTVKLDRHGGDRQKKMVYYYGLQDKVPVEGSARLVSEDRRFGGTIVNPAASVNPVPGSNDTFGGVDGGTGGCSCGWEYTPPPSVEMLGIS